MKLGISKPNILSTLNIYLKIGLTSIDIVSLIHDVILNHLSWKGNAWLYLLQPDQWYAK